MLAFLERLEHDACVELAGVYVESPVRGARGRIADLWQRRGLLAAPLLVQALLRGLGRQLTSPRAAARRRRLRSALRRRTHYVDDLHAAAVLAAVREARPQLGLVYGGPILRPELFEIPTFGTLGIHHGKLPAYRGKKTTFWAVHDGERTVGVAIQRIGPSLDGGEIVMQAEMPVGRRLLPRLVKDLETTGIALYLEAVHAVRDGSATYTPQPAGAGRLYTDPGPLDVLRFWGRYAARLVRG